jgi:hypothetical protein
LEYARAVPDIVVDIARAPDVCWRALVDVASFPAWMPRLRRAVVRSTDPDGLPREVDFERSESLIYTLLYTYDRAKLELRWEPVRGARDAVRGWARLAPHGDGTRLTYHVEQGAGRSAGELLQGGAHVFVDAFVQFVQRSNDRTE